MRDVMEKPRDGQGNRESQALHLLDTPSNILVADFVAPLQAGSDWNASARPPPKRGRAVALAGKQDNIYRISLLCLNQAIFSKKLN
jgi:hypothetical protein